MSSDVYLNVNRLCVHVFIGVSARTYISIYVCTMFLKKIMLINMFIEKYISMANKPNNELNNVLVKIFFSYP
jgi:hypothetical protein